MRAHLFEEGGIVGALQESEHVDAAQLRHFRIRRTTVCFTHVTVRLRNKRIEWVCAGTRGVGLNERSHGPCYSASTSDARGPQFSEHNQHCAVRSAERWKRKSATTAEKGLYESKKPQAKAKKGESIFPSLYT